MNSGSVAATPAQDQLRLRAELDEHGYVIIRDVVSKDRLSAFNALLQESYAHADPFRGGGSISGHLNCFPGEGARTIYGDLDAHGIPDAIRSIRAPRPSPLRPTLNFNLPGSRAQHYHMDGVFVADYLICNVAVVDTDLVNGAIDVLPGTHQKFYPFWRYAIERKHRLSTRLPLSQGDVLLRTSTLWHRGMPNDSTAPRAMLSFTFGEEVVPAGDPFRANGGQISFYPNWYASGRLGALRERIEVKAPITRSAVRFARSLVGHRGYSSY